jgi:iron complex transport system ATP-binding protein
MGTLSTDKLTLAYDQAVIITGMDVLIPSGKITALVGPNGCGKSTLLRGIARLLAPRGGAAFLDGKAIHSLPTRELARQLGILPQSPVAPEGLTVRELVAQGRYPHQAWFQQWAADDEAAVLKALDLTAMRELAERPVDALSGGQRQRAWIAMTLAQETDIILLDEPTTFLDLSHQIEVLQLLERLNRDEGRTIVMVVHDLNHATRHAQYLVALKAGAVAAVGAPAAVVTPQLLREVFGVEGEVVPDPRTGVPLCVAYGLAEPAPAAATPDEAVPQMRAEALRDILAVTEGPLVLDVRSGEEFAAGHVPAARHIPLDELPTRLGELPRDRQIVAYCMMRHPGQSRGERAASLLREGGFDALVLAGGLPAWEAALAGDEAAAALTRETPR